MIMEKIRREHGYMLRLLSILEQKVIKLKNEESVNYAVIGEIVEYLSNHSDAVHHPKEDLMYGYYKQHYGQSTYIDNLELEHKALYAKSQEFAYLLDMVLQDVVVPQDVFIERLEEYRLMQREHLQKEERTIFPVILKALSEDDWRTIESKWQRDEDDPLFGDTIATQYKLLAERVRESELESV